MSARSLVLVAHDSDGIRKVVEMLLRGAGYDVRAVADGNACREALATLAPAALVLDVALPDVLAFAMIEEARSRSPGLRVVLVASIYNRTSYKRRPTSLYGADDYVEQHHIPDSLVGKLDALLGATASTTSTRPMAEESTDRAVRVAGEGRLEAGAASATHAAGIARAERLARLIVTDIALYNGDALTKPIRAESVEQLEARLRGDLEEGRLLFDLRVPAAIRRERDFIGDALRAFVEDGLTEGGAR